MSEMAVFAFLAGAARRIACAIVHVMENVLILVALHYLY
jgi:hypothetical protein